MKKSLYASMAALAVALLCAVTACQGDRAPQTATSAAPATENPNIRESSALATFVAAATSSLQPPPILTSAPLPSPPITKSAIAVTATAVAPKGTPVSAASAETYQVAFVATSDKLNIRAAPGVDNEIVADLDPREADIRITGGGQFADGSLWVPIVQGELQGWVNSRYLTGQLAEEAFCDNAAVSDLLQQFTMAVAAEDSTRLAELIHPQRGLRVRVSWWNPEIRFAGSDLNQLFESQDIYDWGVQDGSGLPIRGTFREVIGPLLQADLVAADESACAKILRGPTAGMVKLPEEYDTINYVGYFREAQHISGFDWGAWAVGVEQWQSRYYVSFLVHYGYEM